MIIYKYIPAMIYTIKYQLPRIPQCPISRKNCAMSFEPEV